MKYQLITLDGVDLSCSSLFLEGAVLAANMATKPLAPEAWLGDIIGADNALKMTKPISQQIEHQYLLLKRNEYEVTKVVNFDDLEQLSDFAGGFMTLWPVIEELWTDLQVADGTTRMLSALLTTMMLAVDEEETHRQMAENGIDTPPTLEQMLPKIDFMIQEVAMAADEYQIGYKGQKVNPYKDVGRNDACPCESGKKFKKCCGK
ncbi:SEC-C metal-binding domain-containing protein [Aliivibrio sifiae]|uniref:Prepilin peptidase n=1 Tax=Aliivibrio sifiae TaxID=566293 RepID=A0A2S7XEM1_9GAMM|nr:SEC-C metal-binding domain-containing protein [Aliivibrio sifiae]PQJ89526.1 prepilin peptidase [Aliivibrio sifiae]